MKIFSLINYLTLSQGFMMNMMLGHSKRVKVILRKTPRELDYKIYFKDVSWTSLSTSFSLTRATNKI